jgi:hypothetical protein
MISGHWFPLKPLIVSPSLRVGLVGDAPAFYMRARLTVGAIFGPAELFAGWEHTQIADEALGGPLFGVRLWL